ncbi:MAG: hypothetical protein WCV67_05920 [Victivallaceae bacterium]|jgi:hypothetical protein
MKTTLFVIIALLLMLNVHSKEKKETGVTASMQRTSFKIDNVVVNIPLPGPDYFCTSEALVKKNTWLVPKPDTLVTCYSSLGGVTYSKVKAAIGMKYEEIYAARESFVKVMKDDLKTDVTLDEFKKLSKEATEDLQEVTLLAVDKLLYEDGKKQEVKSGLKVELGCFIMRDTAYGVVSIVPDSNGPLVICDVTILVRGRIMHLTTNCKFNEASSVKFLMELSRKWADATIKANK